MPVRRLLLFAAFAWAVTARAADWPQWRGPERTDVSAETGLRKSWPAARPKTPLDLPRRRGRLLGAGRRRPGALHDGRREQKGISLPSGYANAPKGLVRRDRAGIHRRPRRRAARHAHGGRRPRLRPRRPGRVGLRRGGRRPRGLAQEPARRPRRRDVVRMGLQRIAVGGRRPRDLHPRRSQGHARRPGPQHRRGAAGAARDGPTRPPTPPWSKPRSAAFAFMCR